VEVKVIELVADAPTATLPKAILVVLIVNPEVPAWACKIVVAATWFAVAVKVDDWLVATDETLATNAAEVAPEGMVTDAGTATAALLLTRLTVCPVVRAAPLKLTEHETEAGPTMALLLQASPLKTGIPVPLRLTVALGHEGALLTMVTVPDAVPLLAGLKETVSARDWPGFKVAGRDGAEILNPAPATLAEVMVRAAFPIDVNVKD
jgi:hypothetical protein